MSRAPGFSCRRRQAHAIVLCCGLLVASVASAETPALRTTSKGGVDARGAALLLSGQLGGDLGGAALWTVTRAAAPGEQVPIGVLLELEGRGLVDAEAGSPGTVDIYAYLIDEAGTVVDHLAEELSFEDGAAAARLAEDGLVFVGEMHAAAGRHSLRLAARSRATSRFFLEAREIDVPAADGSGVTVLPPLVPAVHQRLMAWTPGLDLESMAERTPCLAPWPSAEPVVAPGGVVDVAVAHSPLAMGQSLVLRLDERDGSGPAALELPVDQQAGSPGVLAVSRTSISVPELTSGQYRLTAMVVDGGRVVASSAVPVLVHPRAAELSWDDPEAPRAVSSRQLPLQPDAHGQISGPVNQTVVIDDTELPAPEDAAAAEEAPAPLCGGVEPGPEAVEARGLRGVDARAAVLLLSGQNGGEVAGEVVWTSLGAGTDGEAVALPLVVEVDGRQLLDGSAELPVVVEIFGYLVDASGTVVASLAQGFALDDCGQVSRLRRSGLKFIGELRAPAGPYSLRVLVRNADTRRFFLGRRELEAPAAGSERPLVLPPLTADPRPGWLVAGQQALDLELLRSRLPTAPAWPAALPSWPASRPLDLAVGVLDPGGSRELAVRLADPEGVPMPEPGLTVSPETVEAAGGLKVRGATVAATDLPPGVYRLMTVLNDPDSGETAVRSLPVVIHDAAEPLAWVDPGAPRAAAAPPLATRSEAAAVADVEDAAFRSAYLEVLQLWAAGEAVAARRALAELEPRAAGPPAARTWRRLFNLEHLTVLALADREPSSLMAIAVLHRDMHAWYMARRETDFAEHSWQMAAVIVRTAQSQKTWRPPEGFAECVLLDIAGRLAALGLWQGVERALEVALDFAPDSAPALLGLGAMHERMGDPEAAKWPLQRLVKAHPEHAEGRLRLAVNRARLGGEREAEELFRGLLAAEVPTWIRALAYQELAGLLVADGRAAEAAALLEEATAAIPANQRLGILLVYADDRAGRSRAAAAAAERLGAAVSQQSTSPRYLYSRFPDLDGERVRATLSAGEAAGRAVLQGALQ